MHFGFEFLDTESTTVTVMFWMLLAISAVVGLNVVLATRSGTFGGIVSGALTVFWIWLFSNLH